MKQDNLPSDTR